MEPCHVILEEIYVLPRVFFHQKGFIPCSPRLEHGGRSPRVGTAVYRSQQGSQHCRRSDWKRLFGPIVPGSGTGWVSLESGSSVVAVPEQAEALS